MKKISALTVDNFLTPYHRGLAWSYFVGNLLIYKYQREKIIQTSSVNYNSLLSVISQGWKGGEGEEEEGEEEE